MAKKNPISYVKKKVGPNAMGPGFRTADHFKARTFGAPAQKFNPAQFKVQHKG